MDDCADGSTLPLLQHLLVLIANISREAYCMLTPSSLHGSKACISKMVTADEKADLDVAAKSRLGFD